VFGRATITLGIGPHSCLVFILWILLHVFHCSVVRTTIHICIRMSTPDEFLVAMGASIVLRSRLDGRVHVKSRFDG